MIKAQNLFKKYSKNVAVNNISFDLKPGAVTGFLGPNGSGKTTSMKLMLGLSKGNGETLFGDKVFSQIKNPAKSVGVMLESKSFSPSMSARDHLLMCSYGLGMRGKKAKEHVDEILKVVGLASTKKKKTKKFSLGMSQRLSIATALLGNPDYIILDEPANGLDPEGIQWIRTLLTDLASQGKTVFLSSHLISEISQIATDLIIIGKGELLANDSVENIINRYSSGKTILTVDSSQLSETKDIIENNKSLHCQEITDNKFIFTDVSKEQIGKLMFDNNICVLGLEDKEDSLENIFFQLTENSVEYKATKKVS